MAELELIIKEEERSKAVGWSDLPPDILAEIFRVLDVVDYIRCLSVCASWRSIPQKTMNFCKPRRGRQLPRLMISYRNDSDVPRSRYFYCLSLFHTEMAKYPMCLPQFEHDGRCVGSSQSFLITVDDSSARLCALNPLTGARFPLPPTATRPDILLYDKRRPNARPRVILPDDSTKVTLWYRKAVISPSLDTMAVSTDGWVTSSNDRGTYGAFRYLAFARAGHDSWTALVPACTLVDRDVAADLIFHKGCLYVLYQYGNLVVFNLENLAAPPLVSPSMVPKARCSLMILTETPDGEDLLLLRTNSTTSAKERNLTDIVVFRLNNNMLEWNQVQGIGDVALFFDGVYLSSFSTREFPCLQSNCVYFTTWPGDNRLNYRGVYNLEDQSVIPLSPSDYIKALFCPPIWFTPAL